MLMISGIALLGSVFAMPIGQAEASSDKCSKNSGSGQVIGDFHSAALVCVSRSTALEVLGLDAGSDPTHYKATLCHIPPGNADAQHTISVDYSALPAHMAHGDVIGACSGWVSQSDVEATPACTALNAGSTGAGVWVPQVAAADAPNLNRYFTQVKNGALSGHPDSMGSSYREIRAQ